MQIHIRASHDIPLTEYRGWLTVHLGRWVASDSVGLFMEIRQRLELFYHRLNKLPPFGTHDEALSEISRVLTEVEDEFSGIPKDPSNSPTQTDGRMYPPVSKYAKQCHLPGVILYTQTGHHTYISERGAVLIVNRRTGKSELDRPGLDGRSIQL